MSFDDVAKKKILGVPVLYLGLAGAVGFAILAYKIPSAKDPTASDTSGTDNADATDPYAGLATGGTVTVVPNAPTTDTPNATIQTNSDWVSKGTQWLVAEKKSDTSTALTALSTYVQGNDYTYAQKLLIDAVGEHFGPPPDGVPVGGRAGTAPAKRQGTPPLTHTVKGNGDTSLSDLAHLYYGVSAGNDELQNEDLIENANQKIGRGPWAVGVRVYIPAYRAPKYYYTPIAGMTKAQVAAKNGIFVSTLTIFNNGNAWYDNHTTFVKGQRLRVS